MEEQYKRGVALFNERRWRKHYREAVACWEEIREYEPARKALALCKLYGFGGKKDALGAVDVLGAARDLDAVMRDLVEVYGGEFPFSLEASRVGLQRCMKGHDRLAHCVLAWCQLMKPFPELVGLIEDWSAEAWLDEMKRRQPFAAMILAEYHARREGELSMDRAAFLYYRAAYEKGTFGAEAKLLSYYQESCALPHRVAEAVEGAKGLFSKYPQVIGAWLERVALETTNAEAPYLLGLRAEREGRAEEAERWHRRASERDHLAGMTALSRLLWGKEKTQAEAVALLQQLEERDYLPAVVDLGERYLTGDGVAQDEAKGEACLRKAAQAYEPTAIEALARRHAAAERTLWDCRAEYERAAGFAAIEPHDTGWMYFAGFYAVLNGEPRLAAEWFYKAQQYVHSRISGPLGGGYTYMASGIEHYLPNLGRHRPTVEPDGTLWDQSVAARGYAFALYRLGERMINSGIEKTYDAVRGERYLRAAVEMGSRAAARLLK